MPVYANFCYNCAYQFVADAVSNFEHSTDRKPVRAKAMRVAGFQAKAGNAAISFVATSGIVLASGGSWQLAVVAGCFPVLWYGLSDWILDAVDNRNEWKYKQPEIVQKTMDSVMRLEWRDKDTSQISIDYAEQRIAAYLKRLAEVVVKPPRGEGLDFTRQNVGQGVYNGVRPWLLENNYAVLRGANVRAGVVLTPRCYKMLARLLDEAALSPA